MVFNILESTLFIFSDNVPYRAAFPSKANVPSFNGKKEFVTNKEKNCVIFASSLLNLKSNSDFILEFWFGNSISKSISEFNNCPEISTTKFTSIFLFDLLLEILSNNIEGFALVLYIAFIFKKASNGLPFHVTDPPGWTTKSLLIIFLNS